MGPVLDYKRGLSPLGVIIGKPLLPYPSTCLLHPTNPTLLVVVQLCQLLSTLPCEEMAPEPLLPMFTTKGVLGMVIGSLPGLTGV